MPMPAGAGFAKLLRAAQWLSDRYLVVLLTAARKSHSLKASPPAWSAFHHPVKETWRIDGGNAPPFGCDSAWNKRAASISAPELLGV